MTLLHRFRLAAALSGIGLALAGCTVYEPPGPQYANAPPAYYEAPPAYYAAPAPVYVAPSVGLDFSFGGDRWHGRHWR